MSRTLMTGQRDLGTIAYCESEVANFSFVACALSIGATNRSTFQSCLFRKIHGTKCSVGFPVFRNCVFEDISSDTDGVNFYGSGFSECVLRGHIKNLVFGFMTEHVASTNREAATQFQTENIRLAQESRFALDAREANLVGVAFRGEAIVPFIRLRKRQAVVLASDGLFEKLVALGRAEKNRTISSFYFGTGAMQGDRECIALIDERAYPDFATIATCLKREGINVSHFDE